MLSNGKWQPVPGASGVEIYPLILKPNTNTSNAFILATDDKILLIDTGALPEPMSRIKTVIRELLAFKERPVLIFLTHCHADHCLQAFSDPELSRMARVRIAIQEEGVQALEERDPRRTLADIQRKELSEARIDFVILSGQDRENPGEKLVDLGDGIQIASRVEKIEGGDGADFYRQIIKVGPQADMEIYPMPGHSPDSICLRIGEILFAGDFFFAVNFLIAGAVGWNQADMMDSIRRMLWLVEKQEINCFCTGHGSPLSRPAAIENMHGMLEKTASLTGMNELNCEHMNEASRYALELLEELNEVLAIIAGRLYYLVYYLDYLGESERARKYGGVLDFAGIDELLDEYGDFASSFEAGAISYPALILKAAQLTGKIEKIFVRSGTEVMDKYLLRRAQNTFNDFMQAAGGLPAEYNREELDLNRLLEDLLLKIGSVPYSDDIIDVLENEEQYLDALVARIAFQPIFRDVRFDIETAPGVLPVEIVKDRFGDALLGLLEEIAALDIKAIRISTAMAEAGAVVSISSPDGIPDNILNEKKLRLYQRKFSILGGELSVQKNPSTTFRILCS